MLKMKKILAALSVAVLACNTLGSISANAGTASTAGNYSIATPTAELQ